LASLLNSNKLMYINNKKLYTHIEAGESVKRRKQIKLKRNIIILIIRG
jgi:hypothetical protein